MVIGRSTPKELREILDFKSIVVRLDYEGHHAFPLMIPEHKCVKDIRDETDSKDFTSDCISKRSYLSGNGFLGKKDLVLVIEDERDTNNSPGINEYSKCRQQVVKKELKEKLAHLPELKEEQFTAHSLIIT